MTIWRLKKLENVSGWSLMMIMTMLALMYTPLGVVSDVQSCDDQCQDYNFECSPYLGAVMAERANVDCESVKYQDRCPMTCGLCTKCDQTSVNSNQDNQLKNLASRLTKVEEQINDMTTLILLLDSLTSNELKLESTQSGPVWGDHPPSRLIDKNHDTNISHCFHSSKNGWVSVHLDRTHLIKSVKILNRKDCCENRIVGATVKICTSTEMIEDSCKVFGTVETGPKGGWITVNSQIDGIAGNLANTVRIENSDYINICEVEVFGY